MRIDIHDISKRFGEFTALDDVSLEVPEGSLTALLGPSGSGKSTLLRIIAGLEDPDTGPVEIDDEEVTRKRPQDRGIGFVFQHDAPSAHMTVRGDEAGHGRGGWRGGGYGEPESEFVMGFVGPVWPLRGKLVRPRDVGIALSAVEGGIEAMVTRVVHLGFEVRIELTRSDGEPARAQ